MIQVEHLSKVYGKGENEVVALNDVSFSIKKKKTLKTNKKRRICCNHRTKRFR